MTGIRGKLNQAYREFVPYYLLWYVAIALLESIPFTLFVVNRIMDVTCAVGLVIILWKLFSGCYPKNRFVLLLALFAVAYALTVIVNGFLEDDMRVGLYLVIGLFLFYANTEDMQRFLTDKIHYMIAVFALITGLVSLGMLFAGTSIIIDTSAITGRVDPIGMHPNHSLFGFTGNSNRMTWICLFGIFSSWSLLKNRRRLARVLLIANIALQYCLVVFSNSRGGLLGTLVFFFFATFFLVWKKKKMWQALLVGVVIVVSLIGAQKAIKYTEDSLMGWSHRPEIEQERTAGARIEAYKAGFHIYLAHPILGVGRDNIENHVEQYLPEDSLLIQMNDQNELHSVYITVLAASGTVGAVLLILFFGMHLPLIARLRGKLETSDWLIFSMLLGFLAINLFEMQIMYKRTFSCIFFWYFLGVLTNRLLAAY